MHSMVPDGEITAIKSINWGDSLIFCINSTVSFEKYAAVAKERDELKGKCEKLEQQLEDFDAVLARKIDHIKYLEAIIHTVEVLTGGKLVDW